MANPKGQLTVRIFEDYNTTAMVADLSGQWDRLGFSTQLHGGFKECALSMSMSLPDAWLWLAREQARGRHFQHLEIRDNQGTVWEGRLMDIGLRIQGGIQALDVTALGYYSSLRDRYYDTDDAGMTDWTVGGPHNTGKIIREMVTQRCSSINGTADITLTPEDVVGINLSGRAYPMDNIVEKLAPLAGTGIDVYYFAVWEKRKPYWAARSVANVDWLLSLDDVDNLQLTQQGMHLRNYVLPVVGTAEGTGSATPEAGTLYPRRELILSLPGGAPTTAANNARDAALLERKDPRQDQSFTVKGHVWSTQPGNLTQGTGVGLEEQPKWQVRAGDVIRIRDLVPSSVATGTLDNLRTFYIVETSYNAGRDSLEVVPDRPASNLGNILAHLGLLERNW